MNRKIILFEFEKNGHFGPLTALSGSGDLRCGAFALADKILMRMKLKRIQTCNLEEVSPLYWTNTKEERSTDYSANVVLTPRALLGEDAVSFILQSTHEARFTASDGRTVGFRLNKPLGSIQGIEEALPGISSLPPQSINASRLDYPWELDLANGGEIGKDLQLIEEIEPSTKGIEESGLIVRGSDNIGLNGGVSIGPGAILQAERFPIRLESRVSIGAGAILSAEEGPIWLADGAIIEPGAVIQGPAYIGRGSIVRAGARLNGAVSLGEHCRVGGELSGVIMQGYSNKQHSGYLGGAIVGQWVNLGAATDNSDLKNNYRSVDVMLNGDKIDSGELHVGVFLGDFVRSAIQTRLNSGTVVGTCCNIFGNDFPEKAIPPFVWFGSTGYEEYRLDKALETIRVIMSRREKELTEPLEEALHSLFDSSRAERHEFIRAQRRHGA